MGNGYIRSISDGAYLTNADGSMYELTETGQGGVMDGR